MSWWTSIVEALEADLPDDFVEQDLRVSTRASREAQLKANLTENEARWSRQQAQEAAEQAEAERLRVEGRAEFLRERQRQSRAARAAVPHESYSRQQVFDRDRGRCYMCDRRLNPRDWHVEHVVPIARGGPDTLENVRASCPRCNHRKGTQEPCFRTTF